MARDRGSWYPCSIGTTNGATEPIPEVLTVDGRDMAMRLELFVRSPVSSAEFYSDVLRFRVIEADGDHAVLQRGQVSLRLGNAGRLTDHYFAPEIHRQRMGLGVEVILEVEDVERTYAAVQRRGYPLESPLQERSWGLTDFRIADPDGYYLRITSRRSPHPS